MRNLFVVILLFAQSYLFALDIKVSPGDSIQAAINQVNSSGGGRVLLEPGTYILSESIEMKSNVTLEGSGVSTRLELPLNATYAMIIDDGTEPCVNMTIRNMLLDGNIPESKVSHDPDYTSDPQNPCLGIYFDAYKKETYHTNIIIENVEIHNTVDGCHLKGVKGGYMDNVYMHHNGIFFWPGHNAYLRRCIDFTVKNSKFEDSYNGSGVNCSWSENLLFSKCVVLRSEGRGIRNAASEGFVVHDCIIVDCGAEGIIANAEEGITTSNCDFRRNCISGCAIGMTGGASGVAYFNNVFGNSTNITLSASIVQSGNTSDATRSCADGIGEWNAISVSARVANANPKQILFQVSQKIAAASTYEGFAAKVNNIQVAIESITLLDSNLLAITLTDIIAENNMVTLSYSEAGNIKTENGTALPGIENLEVVNLLGSPFEISTATVETSGTLVNLKFNKEIGTIHNQSENFIFLVNEDTVTTEKTIVGDSTLQVYPSAKIYKEDIVKVSYQPGDFSRIVATNHSELEPFDNFSVENLSALTLPLIPGKIEAEDYTSRYGIKSETSFEGGQQIAVLNSGDWENIIPGYTLIQRIKPHLE